MIDQPEIRVGDKVGVMNSHGLKVYGRVQNIREDHNSGRLIYKVVSPDFVFSVYKRQIVEVHQA
jgi:maltoporin